MREWDDWRVIACIVVLGLLCLPLFGWLGSLLS